MNYTFSFFNVFLAYISNRNPECPHILYNEDSESACCQKEIINLHNRQRAIITPWTTTWNIQNMTWDSELAKEAQEVARKCKFRYEPMQDRKSERHQNLYLNCSKSDDIQPNWTQAIQHWFKDDIVRPNYALSKGDTGQIVWRKLYSPQVGCGYANYKIKESEFFVQNDVGLYISDSGKEFCQFYVCVYRFL